jgi:hypothetical protein
MPYIHILDDNRKIIGSAHVNLGPKGNREAGYCFACAQDGIRALSSALCDFKLPSGRTCDARICSYHAQHVEPDTDYCPKHAQPTLFDEAK